MATCRLCSECRPHQYVSRTIAASWFSTEEPVIARVKRKPRKKRIVILGGGFGGVYAAMHLEKSLGRESAVEICLVSRDNFFLFTPMLHEIAASDLEITNIVNPLRKLLRKVEVLVGDVDQIDLTNRLVVISRGYGNHSQRIDYDHLVIALGSITNLYDTPGVAERSSSHEIASRCDSIARPNPQTFGRGEFGMQSRRPPVITHFCGGRRRLRRRGNGCGAK